MTHTLPVYEPALHSTELLAKLVASLTPRAPAVKPTSEEMTPTAEGPSNPFFDSLRSKDPILRVNMPTLHPTPETENLTLTENGGVTLLSTKSATLDLYLELGVSNDKSQLKSLVEESWSADPLETLKVGFSTRSIGRGKGSKEGFARLLAWLRENHPQTLLNNLEEIVKPLDALPPKKKIVKEEGEEDLDLCEDDEPFELTPRTARSHGSYKDLLDLLVLASLPSSSSPSKTELHIEGDFSRVPGYEIETDSPYYDARRSFKKQRRTKSVASTSSSVPASALSDLTLAPSTSEDPFNRALRLVIARIFGSTLKQDLEYLTEGRALLAADKVDEGRKLLDRISLAAKYAPTEGNFHDKFTSFASTLAEYLFPTPSDSRSLSTLSKALMLYRKQYLVPLREHLEIVERRMSANEWSKIKYNRVPSLAMQQNKRKFIAHDAEGFTKYLGDVAAGKKTISGATTTPATLLKETVSMYGRRVDELEARAANAQFNTLVESLKASGALKDAIGMADVSGSMMSPQFKDGTTPLDSSIALSIIISRVTEPPFDNAIISFTDVPAFIDLKPEWSIEDTHQVIIREGTGYNTDFLAAFRLILNKATSCKLAPEHMVKQIFCFSDMQFDQAPAYGVEKYDTHYDIVEREFKEAGYEIPELVFWNLAAASGRGRTLSKPVDKSRKGCALVSGYSAATLKVFLEGGDFEEEEEEGTMAWEEIGEDGEVVEKKKVKVEMTPELLMKRALGHESFKGLKVYD